MAIRMTDVHYRYNIPTLITVQIDSREKYPILFPDIVFIAHPELTYKQIPVRVKIERIALPYGDYSIKEYPDLCVFERKATQLEIYKNVNESHDRIRQAKAFRRLATSCKFPFLLLEASPAELLSNDPKVKNPELVVHRLALALAKYNLRFLLLPFRSRNSDVRRKVGTFLVHIMLACILEKLYDFPAFLLEE